MKKSVTLCFLVMFSLMFPGLPAYATDVAAPEILSAKLTTPKTIGPGENICMDLKLREATGLNTVFASFNGPYGRTPYAQISSQSQTPEGLYEITLCTGPVENNSWPSGTYQLTNLWLYDTAGNNTSTLNEHAAVLNPTDFAITVEGTTADVAAPEILSAKLTTPKTIGPGENICMDLKLREATGINTVFASFNGPYGRTPYAQISSQSQTPEGLYEITLCTGPVENNSWPSGTYQLTNLWLYDTAGNNTSTLNEHAAVLNPTDFAITVRTVPYPVTPTPVLFTDKDGTAEDTYTVPATTGVDYLIGNSLVQAGTYPGAGTITVTAKARTDYTLTGTTEWTATFKATPYPVTPDPVVFTDKDGTAEDTYTIPATNGVDYLINGTTIAAGTYPATGNLTITAKARTDYTLTGTTEWTATFKATSPAGKFTPVSPTRVLDTRAGFPVGPGNTITVDVAGKAGIPADASAVALNLTVTEPSSYGHVYAAPFGGTKPGTSNVNYDQQETVPNYVIVPVTNGRIILGNESQGTAHLIADVAGYFTGGTPTDNGAYQPLAPFRAADSRATGGTAAGQLFDVQLSGLNSLPADIGSVVVNLTAARVQSPGTGERTSYGHLTAFASGTARPATSNVNYDWATGDTPNLAVVPVGADGRISIANTSPGPVGIIVDVMGYFRKGDAASAGAFQAVAPNRLLDTRQSSTPLGAGKAINVTLTGTATIPAGAKAAMVNLTATEPQSYGHLTAYPSETALPSTSNVNYNQAQTVANFAVVPIGPDGKITIRNTSTGTTHVVLDVVGYILG